MDTPEDLIVRIVGAASRIYATPGIFQCVRKSFYVVIDCAITSEIAISNNTGNNFLLCCKWMRNKYFLSYCCSNFRFRVTLQAECVFSRFEINKVCNPMFLDNPLSLLDEYLNALHIALNNL